MLNSLKSFFRENPTLLLTFCYFIITLIGVLYSYFFYNEFGINIIKFADLSDFLLASILEPRSIGVFIGLVAFTAFYVQTDKKAREKFKWYGNFINKYCYPKYTDPIGVFVIMSCYTAVLLWLLAFRNANEIKAGEFDQYKVRLSDPDQQTGAQTLALLGSTTRFGYFYDVKSKESLVVPLENISFMRKLVPVKEEDDEPQ